MVFDVAADPHEQHDLAPVRPDLVEKGISLLREWHNAVMASATHKVDPLNTVMAEGGPYHVRDQGSAYIERLKTTGRTEIADRFARRHQPYRID